MRRRHAKLLAERRLVARSQASARREAARWIACIGPEGKVHYEYQGGIEELLGEAAEGA